MTDCRRNRGIAFDESRVLAVRVDADAIGWRAGEFAERAASRGSHASVRRAAVGCLRAVTCTDLTTLAGDDTAERVRELCAVARSPIAPHLVEHFGIDPRTLRTASVCVFHRFIETALRALEGSGIPVCTVSAGFPYGLSPLAQRIGEVEASVAAGADEIDAVIMRAHALGGEWRRLYEEVRAFREVCGGTAILKMILATGELGSLETVARASFVCMMAGADFVKTSTGLETVNATLPVGIAIADAIRAYREATGQFVGLKPSGGIRRASQARAWLALAERELGPACRRPALFRLGASSLLQNLESELSRLAGA